MGLDSLSLHLSTIRLRPTGLRSLSFVYLETGIAAGLRARFAFGSTVMEDFFHQTVQTMYQHSKN